MLGKMRKQVADFETALTVFSKLPRRLKQVADTVFGERERTLERQWLAVVLRQAWLGIERVHVRWTTVHEEKDYALGFCGKMRLFGRERIGPQHGRETHKTEPASR